MHAAGDQYVNPAYRHIGLTVGMYSVRSRHRQSLASLMIGERPLSFTPTFQACMQYIDRGGNMKTFIHPGMHTGRRIIMDGVMSHDNDIEAMIAARQDGATLFSMPDDRLPPDVASYLGFHVVITNKITK